MKNNKIFLTKEGYEEQLDLIKAIRKKLEKNGKNKSSSYTEAVGDGWHDNFAFEDAKREELMILHNLEKELGKLKRIVIIENKNNKKPAEISIGDTVDLEMVYEDGDIENLKVKLIGGVNPGKIDGIMNVTLNSPIGVAIHKKKVGDLINYIVNNEKVDGEIISKTHEMKSIVKSKGTIK